MAADDDELLKQTTPGTPSPAVERPRNTGSQRALNPDARRASNPAMPAAPRTSNPAMPAVRTSNPGMPAVRSSNPGMPAVGGARASNPQMRRLSNPAMPKVATGANAAHRPAVPDAGAGPTATGLPPKTDDPTAPGLKAGVRTSGVHKATAPKKKASPLKAIAFSVAVALVFGVGVVGVVLHPELFPGAGDATTSALPKKPVAPAPPKPAPHEEPATPPAEAAKPPAPAKATEDVADDKADDVARPEPSGTKSAPAHHRPKTAKAEPAAAKPASAPAAEPEEPKEQKPPPTAEQLAEKEAAVEGLLAKQESVRGPDPVVRGFLTQVKAEVAAADSDDKKRQALAHLNQLQARLSH